MPGIRCRKLLYSHNRHITCHTISNETRIVQSKHATARALLFGHSLLARLQAIRSNPKFVKSMTQTKQYSGTTKDLLLDISLQELSVEITPHCIIDEAPSSLHFPTCLVLEYHIFIPPTRHNMIRHMPSLRVIGACLDPKFQTEH
jgi:hypothetical protein